MKYLKFVIPSLILTAGIYLEGCGDSGKQEETTTGKELEELTVNSEIKEEITTQTDQTKEENLQLEKENVKKGTQQEVVSIKLPTIQCNSCKKTITKAIGKVEGVTEVEISVTDKTATVSFDGSKTNLSKIVNSITSAGYDANDKKADKEAYEKLDDCCKVPPDKKSKM